MKTYDMGGEVNGRKWSDNERHNSVEDEYKKLVSKSLIGQKMFIRNRNIMWCRPSVQEEGKRKINER